jgi:hypothetical protein
MEAQFCELHFMITLNHPEMTCWHFSLHPKAKVDVEDGPETHIERQATQHGRLPSLLGDGDKGNEIVYGEEKNILYWAD